MARTVGQIPLSIGILMGAIFLILETVVPSDVAYETMIFVYAISLLIVCSALIDTARDGLICGVSALVAQNVGAFVRYAITDGAAIAVALVTYPLFLTAVTYPIAATSGGYIGGKLTHAGRGRRRSRPGANQPRGNAVETS